MNIPISVIVILNNLVSRLSRFLNLGAGATWPGELALYAKPDILNDFTSDLRKGVIIVAGTNGKTTTSLMIKKILEDNGERIVHNASGANLLNGIVSACIKSASRTGRIDADWGVFEVDENSLPLLLPFMHGRQVNIVFLNLFRDQLDRYGEVDIIAEKWEKALKIRSPGDGKRGRQCADIQLIANADDPLIVSIAQKSALPTVFFGIDSPSFFLKKAEHATDSAYCPRCGRKLFYQGVYFSHLGVWSCPHCGFARPPVQASRLRSPLPGLYNLYNTRAAGCVGKLVGCTDVSIHRSLAGFTPAFGRQEEFVKDGKKIKLFLSKNPAGFNASLRTVIELKATAVLLVLNDRIPDGRDVSWIWDVDFETVPPGVQAVVSGDRVYDLALRMKYSGMTEYHREPELPRAIESALDRVRPGETLYVLPTYSAMLEVRKILTGKHIL
ncbi:Mur ligase family protein [Patescibacteria group bacterium]|nr:Mur ligase family protein [Patescibacteria group bacterium]